MTGPDRPAARSPAVTTGSPAAAEAADTPVDVVCLGESMVTFLPLRPGRLADVPAFERTIGGAESNVACALAAAGHAARWVSRVGADGFGDHLVEAIGSYGVDVGAVRRDAHRPTGVYFRTADDRTDDGHEVVYYRAGSAASAMSPATVPYRDLWSGRILHLSGITAALSDDCLALMRDLLARRPGRPLVSFDVNHRPGLWRDAAGPRVLLELARGADIVFVGADEAEAAWGLRGARAIGDALPEPGVLVVKLGAGGAVVMERAGADGHGGRAGTDGHGARAGADGHGARAATLVRPPVVDVVAPVGAGDAFAAGFLSATLRGLPVRDRIRHGHLMAAAVLTVPGDLTQPPARAHADRLVALDDTAWGRLRLGPGWTGDDQEVRTR
ncbi:sugar kinase [Streptomyces sp. NPDC048416]|uniref:sugar kinase n=1 Tax=Streptomyces sp. NPDC048416 TaxID=3365546 RepID=UPI0037114433